MKNIKKITSLFFLNMLMIATLTAQNTPSQTALINTINTKLKKAVGHQNFMTSIKIVDRELKILNRYQNTTSTVNIDKINNVRRVKNGNTYYIKIIAPWGVGVAHSKESKFGSTSISGRMKDKKLVKEIITDLEKLLATYKN